MRTTKELRDLLDTIDEIQKKHMDKYKMDKSSLTDKDYSEFNCTCYQVAKAYDLLMMAITGDWGFNINS